MRIIAFLLLSVFSLLFAKTRCYDFDDYVSYSNDLVEIKKIIEKDAEQEERNNCILEGGVGSVFHIAASIVRRGECGDRSGSTNGYLEIAFSCDYCTGKKMDDKLKAIEED